MKRVVILGSTGSIGTQALEVIAQHPDRLQVVGLAAKSNAKLLESQAQRFGVEKTALFTEEGGIEPISELAAMPEADLVVVSVAGVIGLLPTIAAIEAGKDVALASKEVLVAAGELVMPLVKKKGVKLTPIDSEHSAVFQCLQGYLPEQVRKVVLTASGGPFRGKSRRDLEGITPSQALKHPTWTMGGKITIDSATLMNKGLETIEARWLFDVPIDQVESVIHPQSIVHSFVQFNDGSVLAQLGWPNMMLPIQYALLHPDRIPNSLKPWSPLDTPELTFQPVDHETFPCIGLAVESSKIGGTMPCAMNAANEHAANAFIMGRTSFLSIPRIVKEVMSAHKVLPITLENLLATDREARELAERALDGVATA